METVNVLPYGLTRYLNATRTWRPEDNPNPKYQLILDAICEHIDLDERRFNVVQIRSRQKALEVAEVGNNYYVILDHAFRDFRNIINTLIFTKTDSADIDAYIGVWILDSCLNFNMPQKALTALLVTRGSKQPMPRRIDHRLNDIVVHIDMYQDFYVMCHELLHVAVADRKHQIAIERKMSALWSAMDQFWTEHMESGRQDLQQANATDEQIEAVFAAKKEFLDVAKNQEAVGTEIFIDTEAAALTYAIMKARGTARWTEYALAVCSIHLILVLKAELDRIARAREGLPGFGASEGYVKEQGSYWARFEIACVMAKSVALSEGVGAEQIGTVAEKILHDYSLGIARIATTSVFVYEKALDSFMNAVYIEDRRYDAWALQEIRKAGYDGIRKWT